MDNEKEVINGYAVDSSVWIGNHRVCFGIAEDNRESFPYMICVFKAEGYLYPVSDKMLCYDSFTECLNAYAAKINECVKILDDRRVALAVEDPACLKPEDVEPAPWDVCIRDKVVALREDCMDHGFRDIANQLYYVNSGFGVEAKSRGRACYGWNLYTGKECRVNRPDIMGIVPEEKLPSFAKRMLDAIPEKIRKKNEKER